MYTTIAYGVFVNNGLNRYSYCLNNPIMYIDDMGNYANKNNMKEAGSDLWYRIDDHDEKTEHIHVEYRHKKYAWHRIGHTTREPNNGNLGLDLLSRKAQKKLKQAGVPLDFFDRITYVNIPNLPNIFIPVDFPNEPHIFVPVQIPNLPHIFVQAPKPKMLDVIIPGGLPQWKESLPLSIPGIGLGISIMIVICFIIMMGMVLAL